MILTKDKSSGHLKFADTFFAVYDSSPGRFLQHGQNGMFIISAMTRPIPINKKFEDFTPAEKEAFQVGVQQTKALQNDIRKEGLGYISALGGYPYHDESLGTEGYDANEFSLIVPRNPKLFDEEEFVDLALELCKKYNQESVLISGISFIDNGQARYVKPGEESKYLIDPDFKFENTHVYKEFDPEERPYYTRLKKGGKETFVFDEESKKHLKKYFATRAPHGWAANCAAGQRGELLLDWWN